MSLDWRRAFGIDVLDPNFDSGTFPDEIRRVLMADPDIPGTAQCVAVKARTAYIQALETEIFMAGQQNEAKQKINQFLLDHMVVMDPKYKRTFKLLTENRTAAQLGYKRILHTIEKLQIVLETAISVALSYVRYPLEDQQNASDDDADVWDDEAQRARLDRLDADLFGPYLHLVMGLPNRYNVSSW
jgi:hypothetical protein